MGRGNVSNAELAEEVLFFRAGPTVVSKVLAHSGGNGERTLSLKKCIVS